MNEPVKEPGKWYGPAGFFMILTSAVVGYLSPRGLGNIVSKLSPILVTAFLYAYICRALYDNAAHSHPRLENQSEKTL